MRSKAAWFGLIGGGIVIVSILAIPFVDFICLHWFYVTACPVSNMKNLAFWGMIIGITMLLMGLTIFLRKFPGWTVLPLNLLIAWIIIGGIVMIWIDSLGALKWSYRLLPFWSVLTIAIGYVCVRKRQALRLGVVYLVMAIPLSFAEIFLLWRFGMNIPLGPMGG